MPRLKNYPSKEEEEVIIQEEPLKEEKLDNLTQDLKEAMIKLAIAKCEVLTAKAAKEDTETLANVIAIYNAIK